MKRLISMLLPTALCAAILNPTVFAEEVSTKVTVDSITASLGDTVNIPVNIQNNQGIISLVTEISYDSTALKLVNIKKNDAFWKSASMTPGGDLESQPYRIIWYDGLAKSDFTENGTLAELSFEVLKKGTHEIELTISEGDTFNSNFIPVHIAVEKGTITVLDNSETTSTTTIETTTQQLMTKETTTVTTIGTKNTTPTGLSTEATTTTTQNTLETGKLSLSNVEAEVGETVNMPIVLQNNPGIISLVAEVSYDKRALKLINVKKNAGIWEAATMTPGGDLNAQPYRVIWYDGLAKEDYTANGILAEFTFEVLKEGRHLVELSVSESDTFNSEFMVVPITANSGTINASSETTISTSTTTSTTETTTTQPATTTTTTKTTTTQPVTTTSTTEITTTQPITTTSTTPRVTEPSTTSTRSLTLPQDSIRLRIQKTYSIPQIKSDLTYVSLNPDIADVTANGLVMALAQGSATIKISDKTGAFAMLTIDVVSADIVPYPLGNLNGDDAINAKDATMILIAAARLGTGGATGFTDEQANAADVNSDGAINAKDATAVLRYAAAVGTGSAGKLTDYI